MRDGILVWGKKKKYEQNLTQLFCLENSAGLLTAINNQAIIRRGSGLGERCWLSPALAGWPDATSRSPWALLLPQDPQPGWPADRGRRFCWCLDLLLVSRCP